MNKKNISKIKGEALSAFNCCWYIHNDGWLYTSYTVVNQLFPSKEMKLVDLAEIWFKLRRHKNVWI